MIKDISGERFLHGAKTSLACLLGFTITRFIHFAADQWLIITILVVMSAQLNVGGLIQKSYMRFLGTALGTLIAAVTLYLFGTNALAAALSVIGAGFFFSYLATSNSSINEAGTLGAVTVAIMLLSPEPTFYMVGQRFLEISLGILIAALIAQFVFPIHAREKIRLDQANTLKRLRDYYFASLMRSQTDALDVDDQAIDEKISLSLIDQRRLAKESERELLGVAFDTAYFKQLLWYEKEILRCIAFMHHAVNMSAATERTFFHLPELDNFNHAVCSTLEKLADSVEQAHPKLLELPNIEPLKQALQAQHEKHPMQDIFYVNAYLFCADVLLERLNEMALLVAQVKIA